MCFLCNSRFKSSLELMLCVIDISTINKTYLIWVDMVRVDSGTPRKLVLGSVKSESFTMSNFLSCGGDFKYLFMPWRIDSNEVPSSIWFSQVHVKVSKRLVQSQCHSSQINCPDFFPLGTPVGCLHFSYLLSMCCQHLIWGVLFEFLLLLSQRRPPKDHRWHVCYIGWLVSVEKI